ncbi:MAG: formate dehydrogenase subunit delta [Lautropia sp.]
MNTGQLVRMANQIGAFFDAMPDRAEARAGVVDHIRAFWAPSMRRSLLAHLDDHQGAGLTAFVAQALAEGRARLA